jgi:hypothetical protein
MTIIRALRAAKLLVWSVVLATATATANVAALADELLIPLTELGAAKYRGEVGGLYGDGRNDLPVAQRELTKAAIARIQPLDAAGKPSAGGKIVLLSIGMSNTTQEFSAFARLAGRDRRKRPELVLVDGAQGGADAAAWAGVPGRQHRTKSDPWNAVDARLKAAGVTRAQVQVAWIKQALAGPARYGEFPGHVEALEDALEKIVRKAREEYPNLRVVFLSSRIYGGYATTGLNPEPYANESAFAVRGLIARQTGGKATLNGDAQRGAVRAPVLVWGPYLWAAGETPRRADGVVWQRDDFREDGTHPSERGRRKVAEQMLAFFTQDEFGKAVFCAGE